MSLDYLDELFGKYIICDISHHVHVATGLQSKHCTHPRYPRMHQTSSGLQSNGQKGPGIARYGYGKEPPPTLIARPWRFPIGDFLKTLQICPEWKGVSSWHTTRAPCS